MPLSRDSIFRIASMVAALAFTAGAAQANEPTQVRILMNWFAQADQSGYWQAAVQKLGKENGIDIVALQGGPKIQTIPQVGAGQAEFGVGNADDILLARLRGAPVRAVFVSLDYVPYTLAYHPDPAIKSIADLKQRTFAVSLGFAYWEWIKKRYALQGAREIPVTGDLTLFKSDPNMVQQGYSIFLPYRMTAAGIDNAQFKVPSLGYRPYDVLFTTDEMIAKRPDVVRATVAAVKQGWSNFINDPSKVKPTLMELNKQIPPEVHDLAVKDMTAELLPRDHAKIGCMTDARWDEIGQQLREVNFLPASFDVKLGYDRTKVPGC
jgi:NitT/TauT family transport system substrate-binding protein